MKYPILFLVLLANLTAHSQAKQETIHNQTTNLWLIEPIHVISISESSLSGVTDIPQFNIINKKDLVFVIIFDSINHFADTLKTSFEALDKNKKSEHISFTLNGAFEKFKNMSTAKFFLLWNAEVTTDLTYSVQKEDTIHYFHNIYLDPKNRDYKGKSSYGKKYELQPNRSNIDRYYLAFDKKKHGKFTTSKLNSPPISTSYYFLGYKHGKEVIMKSHDEVDKIINWRFGVLHGPSQNWYQGKLISTIDYENGLRNGWTVTWRDNGDIRDSTFYNNDIKTGKQVEYWSNGTKSKEIFYKNNLKDSSYLSFHKNGKTSWQGYYIENKKQGFWYHYSENGDLNSFESFEKGVSNKDKTQLTNGSIIESEREHYVPFRNPEYTNYVVVIDSCKNLREVIDKTDSLSLVYKDFQIKYIKPNQYKGILKSNYYAILLVSNSSYDFKGFKEKLQIANLAVSVGPMIKISSNGISKVYHDRLDVRDPYGNKQDLILIYQSQEDMDNYEGEDWGWFVNDVGEVLSNSNETFIWGSLTDYLSETEIKRIAVRQQMEGFGYFLYKGETGEMQFLTHDMPSSIIYGINEFFGTEIEME